MAGLDNVKALLAASTDATFEDTIKAIVETKEFEEKRVGVNACLVCFVMSQPNGRDLATRIIDLLFSSESVEHQKSALEFMLLWVRASGPEDIERQVEILERHSSTIKANIEIDKTFNFHQLIIAMLSSRCSSHVLEPDRVVCDPALSKEFLEKTAGMTRTSRANSLRGRLQVIACRIFDETKAKQNERRIEIELGQDDPVIVSALKKVASGVAGPLQFKVITDHLKSEKLKCVEARNRVPRTPARVLTSLESIQNIDAVQDCEVCLQIALMCLIIAQDDDQDFPDLVRHFGKLCHIDGDLLIDAVRAAKQEPQQTQPVIDPEFDAVDEVDESRDAEPILKPFELMPEPKVEVAEQSPEPADNQNEETATDSDDRELKEWRAARLCIADFMNITKVDCDNRS